MLVRSKRLIQIKITNSIAKKNIIVRIKTKMMNHIHIYIYTTMQQYAINHHRFEIHNCKIIVLSISFKNIKLLSQII